MAKKRPEKAAQGTVRREGPLRVGGKLVKRGQRRRLELPFARLPTGTALSLPVTALRGKHPGPTIWLSAAVHGDEVNGTEIIRRVVRSIDPKSLAGSIIAVPIVNVYGFIERSRYLPDRRDLNRSFPGSGAGSLASRLAHLFLREVVSLCEYGIDFHTGARHRTNLSHLRADLDNPEALRLARAFGAPIVLSAGRIAGSLRAEAHRRGIPILVFEGGEPLRFGSEVIEIGVQGTLRVLAELGMWRSPDLRKARPSREARVARWLRAGRSGILNLDTKLGETVRKGDLLAHIADAFSGRRRIVRAPFSGLVMAQTTNPLIYQGDAILRLAKLEKRRVRKKAAPKKRSARKRAPSKKDAAAKKKAKKPATKPTKKPPTKKGVRKKGP